MKKILLIVVTFMFIYPVFPKFLPIPLDRILQLCGLVALSLHPQDLKKIINTKIVWGFYGITLILFLLAFFAQLQLARGLDLYFIKEVFDTFLNIFSAYFIYRLVRSAYGHVSIGLLLYYIVLAALLQTLISFVFFFNNSLFDFYISMLKVETNQGLLDRTSSISRRFMGLGSQFFSGVLKYGVAFFSILVLPYVYSCRLTNNRWVYWISVVAIAIGGIFTGRTFLVAFILGIFMVIMLKSKNVFSFLVNNIKAMIAIVITAGLVSFLAPLLMDAARLDAIYSFAFELFINFFENDSLETSSTNHMSEMYFFPENINTWMFGDGRMISDTGRYYMGTDIGYIRLLFYFGLPSTLFFIYVLYRYGKILMKRSYLEETRYFLFFITIWMLILNFKGLAFMTEYFVLFILGFVFENRSREILR